MVTDGNGVAIRNKYMVEVRVVHLESAIPKQSVAVKPYIAESMKDIKVKERLSELHLQSPKDQLWAGYMGSRGNSVYIRRKEDQH